MSKHGLRLKLTGQPLEILLLLVDRAGELVTREEIRQRLWSEDVFVDFERSLNSAVKKLRAALNDNPDDPRYVETIPRKGYRFIGQLDEETVAEEPSVAAENHVPAAVETAQAEAGADPVSWWSGRKGFRIAAAGLAVVAVLAAIFFVARARRPEKIAPANAAATKRPNVRSSIAILGFKNLSSQREGDWLGVALVQMLATELQSGGSLRIVPDEVVTRAKAELGLKEKDGYPRDTLRALHVNLASDYVVAGSYVALGNKETGQVRLDLRLQETISGETLASIAVSGKQAEIFDLVARAGQEMRTKVGGTIGPEGDVDWRATFPQDPDAARLYSQGLERLQTGDNVSASELLRQSLALEPQFALGHAALAEAWEALGYDARARTEAQKGLSLAASLPENVRLKIEGRNYELQHDWAGAIPAYRHLLSDYPDDLEAGLRLAESQAQFGQLDEASATISSLRGLPPYYREDPRIDLVDAILASRRSDYKAQQTLAEEAARKARASGARLLLARAKMMEGWSLDDQAQLDDALKAYREAQRIFEAAGDTDSTATVLNDIGIVLQKQGNLPGALENLQDARNRFTQVGDENGLGSTLTNLGEVYRAKGELEPAEDLYRQALEIFRKSARKENEYSTLNNLGGLLYERGDFRGARKIFEDLLQARQASGDKSGVAFAKTNLADVLRVQGELDRAAGLQEEALRIFREVGDRATGAGVSGAYARLMILKNEWEPARRLLLEAQKINEEIGAKGDAAMDRVLLAQILLQEGHAEQVNLGELKSAVEELSQEQRGADVMEALAIQTEVLLAVGKLNDAHESVMRGQAVRNTNWLAKFHLGLATARVDAAQGHHAVARRRLDTAQAQAEKAGCKACESELRSLSRLTLQSRTAPAPARPI